MPYIEPEVIEQARQIDLLTYLRKFEPDNVEEVKGTKIGRRHRKKKKKMSQRYCVCRKNIKTVNG